MLSPFIKASTTDIAPDSQAEELAWAYAIHLPFLTIGTAIYWLPTVSHDRECKKIKSFQGSSEVSGPLIESVSDISQHSGIKYGLIVANRGIPWNHRTKTYRRSRLSFKTKNVLKISSFTQQHMVNEVNNNFLKYTFNSKNENRIR